VRKLVLVAIVLIIGLGFLGCDTKKASVNGPQDIETSTDRAVQPTADFGPFAYEVWYSAPFTYAGDVPDPEDSIDIPEDSIDAVAVTVSGNNITVFHSYAPSICYFEGYIAVGAYLSLPDETTDKQFEIQEYETSVPGAHIAGCFSFRHYTITIHNVPNGLYTIAVRNVWGHIHHTLEVAVGVVSTNQPADI